MSDVVFDSKIDKVYPGLVRKLVRLFGVQSRWLQTYLRRDHMSGPTTDDSLSVRSGLLRASTVPLDVEVKEGEVRAGVSIGPAVYARVHIGPRGQVTEIVPKRAKYLSIPLGAVKTKAGVSRGGLNPLGLSSQQLGAWGSVASEQSAYGETFVRKSKAGNLIVFGKQRVGKGAKRGQLKSRVVPLFVLKKSVRVRARIHPEDVVDAFSLKLRGELQSIGVNVTEG